MNNFIKDGDITFFGGVSSNASPDDLPSRFVSWAKNVSFRRGRPRTRPALIERLRLPAGRFQGASYFSAHNGIICAQINGFLNRITVDGPAFAVEAFDAKFQNNPNNPETWWQETDGSLVVQDGESSAILYDGASARRANPDVNEVPIGKMMAYGNGRLWVAVDDHQVKAGNIKQDLFGSELIFTETGYLNGGGAFYFPNNLTGMRFMPQADTTTGWGALIVFCDGSVETLRGDVSSRDLWAQLPNFNTNALPNIGSISHNAIVPLNQDLYFRSADNTLRSLRSARAEINSPGNAPISNEVSRIVDFESLSLLKTSSGIYFDGRLLITASPCFGPYGKVVFKNIISLDVSTLSSMQSRVPPAYDGEWYGIQFAQLIQGKFGGDNRAFAISSDPDGYNRIWEIMKQQRTDVSFAVTSPIRCAIETRRYGFGSKNQLKRLENCKLFLSEIRGSGSVMVYFRGDGNAKWTLWDQFTFNAKMTGSDPISGRILNVHPQFRSAVGTLTAPDDTSVITRYALNVGYSFQIRVVWVGDLQIERLQVSAIPFEERVLSERDDLPVDAILLDATGNEVIYSIPLEVPPVDPGSGGGGGTVDPDPDNAYVDENGAIYADDAGSLYVSSPP